MITRAGAAAALFTFAACAPPVAGRGGSTSHEHLYVWAATDSVRGSLLAVFDIRPNVPAERRLLRVVPAGQGSRGAHHIEHDIGPDRHLFANAFGSGKTFVFDLRVPDSPVIVASVGDVGPYSHPHSYARLPNGNVLSTFQWKTDRRLPGGLVELDPRARPVRWASAAPPSADSLQIVPYSLTLLPHLDRVVSTSTHMIEDMGVHVQVWRLSDLKLLHTLPVPLAATHQHSAPGAEHHKLPGEPRVLADGRTVMFGTFTCGLYHLVGVGGDAPRIVFSASFPGENCAVPVVIGRHWIQTVPALRAIVALDVSNPARPVESSRLVFGDSTRPHWLGADASGRRLVMTSARRGDPTLHLVDFDPATGRLTKPSSALVLSLRGIPWPDGSRIDAVPHGAVFSRP